MLIAGKTGRSFETMVEHRPPPGYLSVAAEILDARSEEIIAAYEGLLLTMGSPLVTEAEVCEQLRAQACSVLKEVTTNLRGKAMPPDMQQSATRLSETIGVSRASGNVHAFHSLRAVVAFSEAALSVLIKHLSPSPTVSTVVAKVAVAIQQSFTERVMTAAMAYADYLLEKVHESHTDERRRISRELHDRVAHSIMVAFRSLEIYELYRTKDPPRAQSRLELAKKASQEALELTRSLSRELRSTSAEEGLEVALSDLLSISVPHSIRYEVSVEGDESLLKPQVRDELFLILREGIRNAVAHSEAKTIKVEVDIAESHVRAAVEDDGRGFEPEEEAAHTGGGTGLASMEERASLLGGNISLATAPSNGARVEVFLPLPRSRR